MFDRLCIACLMSVLSLPVWAGDTAETPGEAAQAVGLNEEWFAKLEAQLETVDDLIDLQGSQLSAIEERKLQTTDPETLASLETLSTRMTRIIDDLEFQRDALREQVEAIRALSSQ